MEHNFYKEWREIETMSNDDSGNNSAKQQQEGETSLVDRINKQFQVLVATTSDFLQRSWTKTKEITNQTIDAIRRGTIATIQFLDHINIIQVLIAIALALVGIYFSYIRFEDSPDTRIWLYVLIFVGVVLGCYTWIYVGKRYFGKILYYVVEQKYSRKIIAGGSFSFYEYKDPEEKTLMSRFTEPIGIILVSLIALLGIASTLIGIIRRVDSEFDTTNPIWWGVFAILSILIATPILPVSWMLEDAQVKAWNEKNHTAWMISSKYKRRLNSIISIGAVLSNLTEGINVEGISNQIEIFGGILVTGALVVFITIGLIVIFYFIYFKNYLRQLTVNALAIDLYTLELREIEGTQFGLEKQELPDEEETTDEVLDETEKEVSTPSNDDESQEIKKEQSKDNDLPTQETDGNPEPDTEQDTKKTTGGRRNDNDTE